MFEDNNRSVRSRGALLGYIWGDPGAALLIAAANMTGAMNTSPTMGPSRALKRKTKRAKRFRANSGPSEAIEGARVDPDKIRVMAYFGGLVADGLAQWHTLDDGTVRLSLNTGEIYLLKETAITRIA